MDKAYFKKYYELERTHWWFQVRSNILRDVILKLKLKNPEILNVGAATYRTSEMLSTTGQTTSLEYDEDCCKFVREVLKKEITQGLTTELPYFDNVYDLTCAFDVIEHIKDDTLAIREMTRVTRSGGFVFITVPAYMFLWSDHDEINHHERRYTYRRLKEKIDTCENMEIVSWTYFNTLLFPLIAIFRLISKTREKSTSPKSDFDNFNWVVLQRNEDKIKYRIYAQIL